MGKNLILAISLFLPMLLFAKSKDIYTFNTDEKVIHDFCLSANNKVVYCTDGANLKAFSMTDYQQIAEFNNGHNQKVLCVDLSSENTMLASGGRDSTVIIWDVKSRTIKQRITHATGLITDVKFSPDSRYVLYSTSNPRAYLYDLLENKVVKEFTTEYDLLKVDFEMSRNLIAIGGADKKIRFYDYDSYNLVAELTGSNGWIRDFKFYDNGNQFVSCGDDGKITNWNIRNLQNIRSAKRHGSSRRILSIDVWETEDDFNQLTLFGTINGRIYIESRWVNYMKNVKSAVSKLKIIENKESNENRIVASTLGSGLIVFDTVNLKTKRK